MESAPNARDGTRDGQPVDRRVLSLGLLGSIPRRVPLEHADMVVEHARAQGITVIARIGLVPGWARPHPEGQDTTLNYIDEGGYEHMGDYVYEFVRHFKAACTRSLSGTSQT